MIDKLERLLKDVTAIHHGAAPTEDELAAAPILTQWTFSRRPQVCLEGFGINHPLLGTTPIITSGLFAIDAGQGWARTYSRFYRLALPGDAVGGEA